MGATTEKLADMDDNWRMENSLLVSVGIDSSKMCGSGNFARINLSDGVV